MENHLSCCIIKQPEGCLETKGHWWWGVELRRRGKSLVCGRSQVHQRTGLTAQRAIFSLHPKPGDDPSRQQVWYPVGCLAGLLNFGDWFPFQMEHLKACAEIAAQRTINWQKFCIKDDCKQCCSFWLHYSFIPSGAITEATICQGLNWMLEIQSHDQDR